MVEDGDSKLDADRNVVEEQLNVLKEQVNQESILLKLTSSESEITSKILELCNLDEQRVKHVQGDDVEKELQDGERKRMLKVLSDAHQKLSDLVGSKNQEDEKMEKKIPLKEKLQESKLLKKEIEETTKELQRITDELKNIQDQLEISGTPEDAEVLVALKERNIKNEEQIATLQVALDNLDDNFAPSEDSESTTDVTEEIESDTISNDNNEIKEDIPLRDNVEILQRKLEMQNSKLRNSRNNLKEVQQAISEMSTSQRTTSADPTEENPLTTLMYTIAFQEAAKAHAAFQAMQADKPVSISDLLKTHSQLQQQRIDLQIKRDEQASKVISHYSKFMDKIRMLEEENSQLKVSLEASQESVKVCEEQVNTIRDMEVELNETKSKLEIVTAEKEVADNTLNSANEKLKELEEKIRDSPATSLEEDLRKCENELARLKELHRTLEEEYQLNEHDRHTDKDLIRALQNDIKAKDQIIVSMRTNAQSGARGSPNPKGDDVRREVARLKAANHAHQFQNSQLEQEVCIYYH